MSNNKLNLESEQKELILARFKTLNPDAKISLGGDEEVTVRELIEHIEKNDEFGKRIVQVQINMLKVLGGVA